MYKAPMAYSTMPSTGSRIHSKWLKAMLNQKINGYKPVTDGCTRPLTIISLRYK